MKLSLKFNSPLFIQLKSDLYKIVNCLDKHEVRGKNRLHLMLRLLLVRRWIAYYEIHNSKQETGNSFPIQSWQELTELSHNVGDGISSIMKSLEEFDPSFATLLTDSHYFRWSVYPDNLLIRVIKLLSKGFTSFSSKDEQGWVGKVLEEFLDGEIIADKELREYFSPATVTRLMVRLLDPKENWEICDFYCGLGRLLVESFYFVKDNIDNSYDLKGYGQEQSAEFYGLSRLYLAVQGIQSIQIKNGDVITDPQRLNEEASSSILLLGNELKKFDGVISILPLTQREWGKEAAKNDVYNRFSYGISAETDGEGAYLQHGLSVLKPEGTAVMLIPPGFLFRERDKQIRQEIIKADLLKAVISLPNNLFYDSRMPTVILIFQRNKPENARNQVLFIDASKQFKKQDNLTILAEENIVKIVGAYQDFQLVENLAAVISNEKIVQQDYNLSITRYITQTTSDSESELDLKLQVKLFKDCERARDEAIKTMDGYLRDLKIKID